MWLRLITPPLFLSSLFKSREISNKVEEPVKNEPNYYDFLLELEKGKAKNNQILADMRLESDIRRDVLESFLNWNNMTMNIIISKGYLIILHDEETAKFKNQEDIDKYKKELFKELQEEYLKEAWDIPISLEEIERIENNPWEFSLFTRSELIKRKNKLKQNET